MNPPDPSEFEKASAERPAGLGRELLAYLRQHKKWWLIPILIALAIVAVLVALSATGLAPFLYPL